MAKTHLIVQDPRGVNFLIRADDSRLAPGDVSCYSVVGLAQKTGRATRQQNGYMATPYTAAGRRFMVFMADWSAQEVETGPSTSERRLWYVLADGKRATSGSSRTDALAQVAFYRRHGWTEKFSVEQLTEAEAIAKGSAE